MSLDGGYISSVEREAVLTIQQAKHADPVYLQFQDRWCIRCAYKLIYEESATGRQIVKVVDEDGDEVPYEESKCHPIFIRKHSLRKKFVGGIGHIATLGIAATVAKKRGKKPWPGFTNSEEICPKCELYPGSEGCTPVGETVVVSIEQQKKELTITTAHSTDLDMID